MISGVCKKGAICTKRPKDKHNRCFQASVQETNTQCNFVSLPIRSKVANTFSLSLEN
jgi:hypothetical protein